MFVSMKKSVAVLPLLALLTGCVSSSSPGEAGAAKPEATPQSALAAASDPTTPQTLATGKLSGCLLEGPYSRAATETDVANFDAAATQAFATLMAKAEAPVRPYADKVRAYSYVPPVTGGENAEQPLTCYYEKRRDDLRFLTWIAPNPDPISQEAQLREAVLVSYAKMAGKSTAKVRAAGVLAD